MSSQSNSRLSRFFPDYHEASVAGFSSLDKRVLRIRSKIDDLLYRNEFAKIEGILMGLLYSDRELATQVVLWRSKWNQDKESLLGSIMCVPKIDPPLSLLQLVVDLAPSVIYQDDAGESLPIQRAIFQHTLSDKGKYRSLQVIKFLADADPTKETLTARAVFTPLELCVFREDEDVARYLLSFPEVRRTLVTNKGGRGPLYYASRDLIKPDLPEHEPIPSWLQFWMIEVAKEVRGSTPCCTAKALESCSPFATKTERLHLHCKPCNNCQSSHPGEATERSKRRKI